MHIHKLFDYSVPLVAASTILVVGGLLVSAYGGRVVTDIQLARDTIEVTGSAKQEVTADTGRWTINLETRTGNGNQQEGFDRLEKATAKIMAYLRDEGIDDSEAPTGSSYPQYYYPQNGAPVQTGYTVSRSIIVRSTDIEKLNSLANAMTPLMGPDYTVSTGGLELTVSTLSDLRVALLKEAIKDAEARADAIASESSRSVGVLRNAEGGVVQVLPKGGIDVSDYGSYDTQSKEKEVMVTVRATFSLE